MPVGAEESRALAGLRGGLSGGLVPKLLSGELRVPVKALAQAGVPAVHAGKAHQ